MSRHFVKKSDPVFENVVQGVKNEAAVVGQTLVEAPSAIWDELRRDFTTEKGSLLAREGASLGVGAAAGILLSRCGLLGRLAIAVPTAYFGLRMASGVTSVVGRAWDADTDSERQALVKEASLKLGRETATTIETMPALMAGGAAGVALGRNVSALDRLAFRMTTAAEFPARRMLPESLHWRGPGSETLPAGVVTAGEKVNMVRLSEILAERHLWTGVEQARSVRLADGRMSRLMSGTPLSTELGFADKAGRVMFHTHPPYLPVKGRLAPGSLPSVEDLAATMEVGVIQSGDLTTIYRGAKSEFLGAKAGGAEFAPTLKAVILDRKNQLAVELESTWSPLSREFKPSSPRPLDYGEALKTLSNWDRNWSAISSVPTDAMAGLEPAFIRLLKLTRN